MNDKRSELTKGRLLEAGVFFAREVMYAKTPAEIGDEVERASEELGIDRALFHGALTELAENAEKAEEAMRLFLALGDAAGMSQQVDIAVEGAGRKQGVIELALIASMALGGLLILATKGKKGETHETQMETKPDGTVTLKVKDRIDYFSPGQTVAAVLAAAYKKILGGSD